MQPCSIFSSHIHISHLYIDIYVVYELYILSKCTFYYIMCTWSKYLLQIMFCIHTAQLFVFFFLFNDINIFINNVHQYSSSKFPSFACALIVLLLSTPLCCQPTELILGFPCFIYFPILLPPPPQKPSHQSEAADYCHIAATAGTRNTRRIY